MKASTYTAFDIVVIAASQGGVEAIPHVIGPLPSNFPAALAVMIHMSNPASYFVDILQRATSLDVKWAQEGDVPHVGQILVASPDYHLMFRQDRSCHISRLPKVNYVRPSADILFQSAARAFGERVLGVILSGTGRDGAVGTRAVKNAGGRILVQNKESCASFDMPKAAIESGAADFMLPLDQISSAIHALVAVPGASAFFRVSSDFALAHVEEFREFNLTF